MIGGYDRTFEATAFQDYLYIAPIEDCDWIDFGDHYFTDH